MVYDLNLAKNNVRYSEDPPHLYEVKNNELVPYQEAKVLYNLQKDASGRATLIEVKGVIVKGVMVDPPHEQVSLKFVPALIMRNLVAVDDNGNIVTVRDLDEKGHLVSNHLFPVYRMDENGQKQYYEFGKSVTDTPLTPRFGAVWVDSESQRDDAIKAFIHAEEKYLLDGHRDQHIIEQNIDMLGRLLNKAPIPPYIPTED